MGSSMRPRMFENDTRFRNLIIVSCYARLELIDVYVMGHVAVVILRSAGWRHGHACVSGVVFLQKIGVAFDVAEEPARNLTGYTR
jgi:hypothetical protein